MAGFLSRAGAAVSMASASYAGRLGRGLDEPPPESEGRSAAVWSTRRGRSAVDSVNKHAKPEPDASTGPIVGAVAVADAKKASSHNRHARLTSPRSWLAPLANLLPWDTYKAPSERMLSVSTSSFKGQRPYMEDDMFVSDDGTFAGVFDGHGGAAVSMYLRQKLHTRFLEALPATRDRSKLGPREVRQALVKAFKSVDDAVVRMKQWAYIGSTAAVVVVQHDEDKRPRTIVAANVGDSRAVLSRRGKAVDLTTDHKPYVASELVRVRSFGGVVQWHGYTMQDGTPIKGMGAYRINGNMAVARAIGNTSNRPFLTGDADVTEVPVEEGDEFVILASDGLWDVMTSDEAVELIHSQMGARNAAGDATDNGKGGEGVQLNNLSVEERRRQMARWLCDEAVRRGTSDNTSVVVMWLR